MSPVKNAQTLKQNVRAVGRELHAVGRELGKVGREVEHTVGNFVGELQTFYHELLAPDDEASERGSDYGEVEACYRYDQQRGPTLYEHLQAGGTMHPGAYAHHAHPGPQHQAAYWPTPHAPAVGIQPPAAGVQPPLGPAGMPPQGFAAGYPQQPGMQGLPPSAGLSTGTMHPGYSAAIPEYQSPSIPMHMGGFTQQLPPVAPPLQAHPMSPSRSMPGSMPGMHQYGTAMSPGSMNLGAAAPVGFSSPQRFASSPHSGFGSPSFPPQGFGAQQVSPNGFGHPGY